MVALGTSIAARKSRSPLANAERIVAHRFRRLAVAEQVGCDHVVVLGEPRVDGAPGLGAACKAVDEHHGLAATAAPVADFVTVNDDARKRE